MVCVSHTITTKVPISTLKRDIRNVLSTCRATVTVHTWKTLDVRDAGWLLQMHPRTHNRDNIALRLRQATQQISNKQLPEFRLYVKTISDKKPSDDNRISVPVIVIECESSSLTTLREHLHTVYSSNKVDLPGKFIPMNFPHIQSVQEYTQLIHQHKSYLDNHRNITVSNVTYDDLNQLVTHNNTKMSILSAIDQFDAITWISPDTSSSDSHKINISTMTTSYVDTCTFVKNIILSNVPKSTTSVTYNTSTSAFTPPAISPVTKNYLTALTSSLPPPPQVTPPFVSQPYSHTIATTNVSSITSLTIPSPPNIQLANIKEHISRSLKILRQEFQTLQSEVHNEIRKLQTTQSVSINGQSNTLTSNVTNELNESILSIKQEFESFRLQIQKEMKQHLQTTISIAIKTTTENLTKMITTEVDQALRAQLNALSPRNRKPKRSRAPNLDDSISQRLFSARSHEDFDDDDPYEASNALFEANMTDVLHSPTHSDTEEVHQHHP